MNKLLAGSPASLNEEEKKFRRCSKRKIAKITNVKQKMLYGIDMPFIIFVLSEYSSTQLVLFLLFVIEYHNRK